jgi:hypothetical protein
MSDTLFLSGEVCFELAFCASKTKIHLEICKLKSTCHPVSHKTLYISLSFIYIYIYVWYRSLKKYKNIKKYQKLSWHQNSRWPPKWVFSVYKGASFPKRVFALPFSKYLKKKCQLCIKMAFIKPN